MVSEKEIATYKLAQYFVAKYQYKIVEIQGSAKEIWLGSTHSDKYPVIRISTSSISSTFFDKTRLLEIHDTICKFFNVKAKLLDIHLDDEAIDTSEDDLVQVTIVNDKLEGTDITQEFPDILTFSNDQQDKKQFNPMDKLKEMSRNKAPNDIMNKKPVVSFVVAIICLVVFVLVNYITGLLGGDGNASAAASIIVGGYYKAFVVVGGEFFRFLTSGFVHYNMIHLLVNMIALINLGQILEKVYSRTQYLLILLGSIITGCVFVFVAQGNVLVVGISGGLYGLMAALLVYGFDSKVIYNPAVARSFISTLLINVMISFLPGVSFFGHMGGFIGGLFIALFITKNKTWKLLKQNALIALAILLVFVGYRATKSFTISPIYYITDLQVLDFMDSVGFKGYSHSMLNKLNKFYGFEIK